MKNFNVKQSGSEVILEEVNPYPQYKSISYFTPLILTSIDPQIKIGDLIREDQLEYEYQLLYYPHTAEPYWKSTDEQTFKKPRGMKVRQVAKLKQPVHETPKPVHDLETCTEKEEKVTYPIGGFAPGNYTCKCRTCNERFQGDKRAYQCKPCALKYETCLHCGNSVKPNQCCTNCGGEEFMSKIPVQEHKPESEDNVSIERINKYARHQFNRGEHGLELVPFEEWIKKN